MSFEAACILSLLRTSLRNGSAPSKRLCSLRFSYQLESIQGPFDTRRRPRSTGLEIMGAFLVASAVLTLP